MRAQDALVRPDFVRSFERVWSVRHMHGFADVLRWEMRGEGAQRRHVHERMPAAVRWRAVRRWIPLLFGEVHCGVQLPDPDAYPHPYSDADARAVWGDDAVRIRPAVLYWHVRPGFSELRGDDVPFVRSEQI